jgi:hypothetical protein
MTRKVNQELRDAWRQRIEQQRRSGLTVAEFSRQEGVSTASFYRWQQELDAVPAAPAQRTARPRPAKTTAPTARTVSPLRTDARFVQLPLASTSSNPWIELMLTDGTLIRLPQQNLAALQAVLHARRTSGTPPGAEPREVNDRGSVTSYAWLYRGLDGLAPYNVFHWSLAHQHAVVDAHLASFCGMVVGDAFTGYTGIEERSQGRILHASCNMHARREFVKAEVSEPILSAQAESLYRQLYDVEERGKSRDAQGLLELRQREAVQIWQRFDQWLESEPVRRVLPQSPLGKAVTYMRNQWTALQRYLSDSRIPIDNSQSEQDVRPLTVGRANWKFLGHPQAAAGRLQLVSIVSSAARHHLMVHDYLEDVLRKLADAAQHHPAHLELGAAYLLDLLPDRWAAAHPQSVRHERIAEQQQVAENKRARRARQRILDRRRAAAQR